MSTFASTALIPETPGSAYATPKQVNHQYVPESSETSQNVLASISLISAEYSHLTAIDIENDLPGNEQWVTGNRTILLMVPESKIFVKKLTSMAQTFILTSQVENDLSHGVEFNLYNHWQQSLETTNFGHWYDTNISAGRCKARILKDLGQAYWMQRCSDIEQTWLFEKMDAITRCI